MKLLLDTHVVLWQLSGERQLGPNARQAITEASELAFSVVSFAEIGIKAAVGKLQIPDDLYERVVAAGVRIAGLSADHGLAVARLPLHHRDPFDRLLITQAATDGYTLMTADQRISAYNVTTISPLC